jgi:hypothetical protein
MRKEHGVLARNALNPLSNFRDLERPLAPLFEDNIIVEDIPVTI